MRWLFRILIALGSLLALGVEVASARDLSFEERVRTQEAIERVYYSHQIGATKPFEEAVPRGLLERQVRDYLKKSAALDLLWRTPVTGEALRAELERIARNTRFPGRLREIFSALGDDPVILEECFARASLVDRLSRSFFAADARIHGSERGELEALRKELVSGAIGLDASNPHRSVAEILSDSAGNSSPPHSEGSGSRAGWDGASRRSMSPEEFRQWRSGFPGKAGEIGPILDRGDRLAFRVVLSEERGRVRVATYSVARKDYAAWWEENRKGFHEESVRVVAAPTDPIPAIAPDSGQMGIAPAPGPAAPASPASACLQAAWDHPVDIVPDPHSGHVAVWTGTEMVIWGGTGPLDSPYLTTGWRYDPLTDTWAPISGAGAPAGRQDESVIWTGSEMIVWGGQNPYNPSPDPTFNTGGRYNPSTDAWAPTTTVGAPEGRFGHTAVWTGDEMIVYGGWPEPPGGPVRSGGRYDPAADSWSPMADSPPLVGTGGRADHSAVWTGSEMLVWGGRDGNAQPVTAPIQYDPATDQWSAFARDGEPSARYLHSAIWTGSRMIVWGGRDGSGILDTGGQYDPASHTWTPTSTLDAPSGGRAVWSGSLMLTWNGTTASRYDPAADVWTPASTLNGPSKRDGSSVVWAGGRMIVWGGDYQDTGGRYDPVTDTWTPTSASAGPAGRKGHAAIWTGSLMIVWGGWDTTLFENVSTGGRYDPLTDSWTPTSLDNAPSSRSEHSAVWTGQAMIIWGSVADSAPVNTGGVYDPVGDLWLATSTVDAPDGNGSTAVWTGTRMIVWGGQAGNGGIYDPAADSWAFVSSDGAPEVRAGHTAVWTGSRMVVWGGSVYSGGVTRYFNTGGRYDPAADSWAPLTAGGGARGGHTAVWTGSRMIVWGGLRGSSFLDSGAQYDPQADRWFTMALEGAPSGRHLHSAVWTGSEMVVWGGSAAEFLDSGGRFDPAADAWIATPAEGAPYLRAGHTAVWTGSDMIVWGGYNPASMRGERRLSIHAVPVDADGDGYTTCGGDCDDTNPAIHPGAPEICNGIDDTCDGRIDEGFDQDGDGYTSCGGDCNDADPAVHPGAAEICDGIDDNCNGLIDEGFPDLDGDGWAACVDCDDTNPAVHPGAVEICDGLDNNCNGLIDEGFDQDGDGVTTCAGDCNDADPLAWYFPIELWNLVVSEGSPSVVSWDDLGVYIGPETVNDLSSGGFSGAAGIDFSAAACLESGGGASVTDTRADPALTAGFWYLARARNSCGTGTYGSSQRDAGIPSCP